MIVVHHADATAVAHLSWYRHVEAFLAHHDVAALAPGRYEIQGTPHAVIIADDDVRADVPALEAHRRYIDVQMAFGGTFDILWHPRALCASVRVPYSEEDDIEFFDDAAHSRVRCGNDVAVILFPNDAHAPQPPQGPIRKAVFKIDRTALQEAL